MFKRLLEKELISLAKDYPVVTLIGPRQSGKTTLVKHTFASKEYVNLEFPDIRDIALNDPRSFLEKLTVLLTCRITLATYHQTRIYQYYEMENKETKSTRKVGIYSLVH